MRGWGDGKRFLFDHIFDSCLYGSMFLCGAFLDPILNVFTSLGLVVVPDEPLGHPFAFGKYQTALLVMGGLQILRLVQKWNEWRYYE